MSCTDGCGAAKDEHCWNNSEWTEDPARVTPEMREAMRLLLLLTDEQRGLVLCWFCKGCNTYVGPGRHCYCMRDD